MTEARRAEAVVERLPALELDGAEGPVRLRAPELGSPALLMVRDVALDRARDYIAALEERSKDLRDWYGRPLVVTEEAQAHTTLPSARAGRGVWEALRIGAGRSALIIADRWGVVYVARETTTFDDLPPAAEVEEWLRYLATQCPECGVIDAPGHGEWEA